MVRRHGGPARRRSPFFNTVLTLIALFLLYLAVPNIGTVIRAARADGIGGRFTARQLECIQHPGHESCTWTGDFRSSDGGVRKTGVAMYGSSRESLRTGQEILAVDVGRPHQVYGPGGSMEWVFTGVLLLIGVAIPVYLYGGPLRRALTGRAASDAPDASREPGGVDHPEPRTAEPVR
ncbi:hypothetical protein AB0D67_27425 [Streptosporangium sp. NPDC048047]|uniref:hypothetical protein n=1 Tax=Streptosporangium sp. NPDC048047 TaxID=3155748 RepID=UPI003423FEEC